MDYKIFACLIVLIIAIAAVFVLWPRDNALHRNLRPKTVLCIIILLVAIIAVSVFMLRDKIARYGIGGLFTYHEEKEETKSDDDDSDIFVITVCLDEIHIDDKSYNKVDDIKEIISEEIASGKKIRVIDDYALASVYESLLSEIQQRGNVDIEKVRQP